MLYFAKNVKTFFFKLSRSEYEKYSINTITADAQAPCVTRSPAAMVQIK